MSTQTSDFRRWIAGRIAGRSCALLALILVVLLSSCNAGNEALLTADADADADADAENHVHQPTVQPTGNSNGQSTGQLAEIYFTDSNEDIWPPQPRNISNVKKLVLVSANKGGSDRSEKENAKQATLTILSDPKVAAELGDHYAMLAKHHIKDKAGNLTQIETEFFIYSSNKVLSAKYRPSEPESVSYTVADASRYQPPESQQEVQKAVALAGNALGKQGFTNYKQLTGTALLAYPTATEVAQDGKVFFDDRKLYVTFGPGHGAIPHYRALVNLSNGRVESSGAMQ